MMPPSLQDTQAWSRMASKIKNCPNFPKELKGTKGESYKEWRMGVSHWLWGQRRLGVCESMLTETYREALKDGAGGVYQSLLLIDPRILGHPGRPRYWSGANDPGELSGVVWHVEKVLDVDHQKKASDERDRPVLRGAA
jgi:hypothetical protein